MSQEQGADHASGHTNGEASSLVRAGIGSLQQTDPELGPDQEPNSLSPTKGPLCGDSSLLS